MANASVAQLVEQGTENPRVVGSIPTGGTTYADLAHLVERRLAKAKVAGSSPVIRSIKKQHPKGCCFFMESALQAQGLERAKRVSGQVFDFACKVEAQADKKTWFYFALAK